MGIDPGISMSNSQPGQSRWQRVFSRPTTRLGWWAVVLGVVFVVLMVINSAFFFNLPEQVGWRTTLLPFYGIFMLACGLSAGIVGLVAIIWKYERSWLVWLPLLVGLFVIFLLLGEFLVPH